ncbi:unnamed protein product [Aspergillus oryzae RIB40]|uniref:DNA, SC011 n=1 Tax=Aspergillus oryzae (strain ATCC 42149 / RIB 40) TaxID=510516 RepID=Q2TZS8_ASPOR|nr:unnamed protein product [Aspergillus oryzae RIB40]BAE65187.1 unnamed protein product [Aspergillus oryzae RIB40]
MVGQSHNKAVSVNSGSPLTCSARGSITSKGPLRWTIAAAKILLCTSQVVDTDIVRKYGLGTQNDVTPSRGIVVIADEGGQCLETEAWIPVAALGRAHDIKGIIRFGDRFQLGPVVMNSGDEPFNEFASQISRSLFDRILRSTETKVSLNIQQRMRPELW